MTYKLIMRGPLNRGPLKVPMKIAPLLSKPARGTRTRPAPKRQRSSGNGPRIA